MRTRKTAAWIASAALAIGLMGAGVTALFTWQGTATHAVNVGTFDFALSSTTPGAQWTDDTVTCPTFVVTSAYDPEWLGAPQPTCNITVTQVGSIDTAKVQIFATATGSADVTKFRVTPNGAHWFVFPPGHPAAYPLSGTEVHLGDWIGALPASINLPIAWNELNNDDLGESLTVSYRIFVYE
jgi:hypothetical protein